MSTKRSINTIAGPVEIRARGFHGATCVPAVRTRREEEPAGRKKRGAGAICGRTDGWDESLSRIDLVEVLSTGMI